MTDADRTNALIAQVCETRATLAALEKHLQRTDLGPDEHRLYANLVERAHQDDAAVRGLLEEASGVRLTPVGRWLEPTRPGDVAARRAHLARHLPAGTEIDTRSLTGGLVALLYVAVAPVPFVTPVDRARGRARAEVRGA